MSHEEAQEKRKADAAGGASAGTATTAIGEGMGKHGTFTVEVSANDGAISWKHDLMQFGGHNIKRSIIPITHSGSEMITKLTDRAKAIDVITLIDNTQATELVTDRTGKVVGVKVKTPSPARRPR